MIDFGFAALFALVAMGVGKRLLDWLGQSPAHPFDAAALALPVGMGAAALGMLALGELGCLNIFGVIGLLAVFTGLGAVSAVRLLRQLSACTRGFLRDESLSFPGIGIAFISALALLATAVAALAPVTDGDALCYHLQVPKVFLIRQSIEFLPDLHETVYPLLTELLYAIALAIRGPVTCRGIQWFLGLALAANVTALARPSLGNRAWWAGAFILLVPAVSNGMSAPLNDVALAAFGMAALFAWSRLLTEPSYRAAITAGLLAGLAAGVKYPALILCALLAAATGLRARDLRKPDRSVRPPPWSALTFLFITTMLAVSSWWYLRAYMHTGNPVYPFFRNVFGGAGLDEVLDPAKRPLAPNLLNLVLSIVPLSIEPDRFDSFSHQFGPIFLLFLPALLLERAPRRVLAMVGLGYLFLILCMTQRQSMRFLLIALGPLSVGVAYLATVWCRRKTLPARCLLSALILALGFEAGLAAVRARHGLSVLLHLESVSDFLARREPTFTVGQWVAANLPAEARIIGQDHRGFYIPRDYTMELAHRRRTGLGTRGEPAGEIIAYLIQAGFTHVMFCPPRNDPSVEFDPTLGHLLSTWTSKHHPVFQQQLSDGDGVLRDYSIYELKNDSARANADAVESLTTTPRGTVTR